MEQLKCLPPGLLLRQCIEDHVRENPITDDDKLDLNPHLQVENAALQIAIKANSLRSSEQPGFFAYDVVIAWLTMQLYK